MPTILNAPNGQKTTLDGTELIPIDGSQYITAALLAGLGSGKAITMWHDQSIKTVGNSFSTSIDAAQAYGHVRSQSAAANGDTWTNAFVCLADTYTFSFLSSTDSNRGKMDFYVDNVQIGTIQDFYSASLAENVILTIASISVTDGYHVLKGVVNGKNGSSSGYTIALTKIWLLPSAY